MARVPKIIKNINLQTVIAKEAAIEKLTRETLRLPFSTLDHTTSFLLSTLRLALKMHKTSRDQKEKDFLKVYLTVGNAALHIIRTSRLALLNGYYGSVLTLNRALQNYLYTLMHVHHHPEDCIILLEEEKNTFKKDKKYREKFQDAVLRQHLSNLGYDIAEEESAAFAKLSHGSVWSAQVFGFTPIDSRLEGRYEIRYAPEFEITKSLHTLALILLFPLDFARFFIMHFDKDTKAWRKLKANQEKHDAEADKAIRALGASYQFLKNAPKEAQERLSNFLASRPTVK